MFLKGARSARLQAHFQGPDHDSQEDPRGARSSTGRPDPLPGERGWLRLPALRHQAGLGSVRSVRLQGQGSEVPGPDPPGPPGSLQGGQALRALDTNILVRFLVADDPTQARRVKTLFEGAEASGESFKVTLPVVLELIWVLSAVYDLSRREVLDALELLTELPILELEDPDSIHRLIHFGRASRADLPDLLIGLAGEARDCESALTLDRRLVQTGLFEYVGAGSSR